jgi:hypothetical protein
VHVHLTAQIHGLWISLVACRLVLEQAVTVAEKFMPEEVQALARAFDTPSAAGDLLWKAGLPAERFPAFGDGMSAVGFWTAVVRELEKGRAPYGRRRLLEAAADEYPANEIFGRWLVGPRSGDDSGT